MATKQTDKALANISTADPSTRFPALVMDSTELAENLADNGLTWSDLTRVSVPGHKSAAFWSVGDAEPVQYLEGIVIAFPEDRTMWETPVGNNQGGFTQPDCHGTKDPTTGVMTGTKSQEWIYQHFEANKYVKRPEGLVVLKPGIDGGSTRQECNTCPFGQFKTAANGGEGQFCNLKNHIYLLTEDSPIPVVVMAATKSLKAVRQYFIVESAKKMRSPLGVITRLGLLKAGQGSANPYYTITFEEAGTLSPDLKAKARAYAAAFKPFIEKMAKPSATAGMTAGQAYAAANPMPGVTTPDDFDIAEDEDEADQPL
jgi:hypothetical protein